jgi:hypothetical protein
VHAVLALPLALLLQTSLTPTAYDDGRACPAECDAHVVVNPRHNGSPLLRQPASTRAAPKPCIIGSQCLVCFSDNANDCIEARYRGAGPPPGRADFTPAFYAEVCGDSLLPRGLRSTCRTASRAVAELGKRRNCFRESGVSECYDHMAAAQSRKAVDDSLFQECRSKGEPAFNREHRTTPKLQLALGCAYERFGTGRNRAGTVTWRRLLDGACRDGSFAGRDGLDCCSDDLWAAALFGRECARFFPARERK